MFSALAMNHGDLQAKVNIFIALAPVANLKHTPNEMLKTAASQWRSLEPAIRHFNAYEIRNPAQDKALTAFCTTSGSLCDGIKNFLNMELSPYNVDSREIVSDYRPGSSCSLKQVIHYGQLANSGVFKQYDYGSDAENTKHYGTHTPPLLPLSNIKKVPIAMFVGLQDVLADPTDTRLVRD